MANAIPAIRSPPPLDDNTIIVKPLPWRSFKVTDFFQNLDALGKATEETACPEHMCLTASEASMGMGRVSGTHPASAIWLYATVGKYHESAALIGESNVRHTSIIIHQYCSKIPVLVL